MEQLTQLAFNHYAELAAGEFVHEVDRFGPLEACHPLPAPLDDRVLVAACARRRHDDRVNHLAPCFVGNADNGGLGYGGPLHCRRWSPFRPPRRGRDVE